MSGNTPIDEYIFWKLIIEEKQDAGEVVPDIIHELLEQAKKKTLYDLIDTYSNENESIKDKSTKKHSPLQ